jgi:hypothetical protein
LFVLFYCNCFFLKKNPFSLLNLDYYYTVEELQAISKKSPKYQAVNDFILVFNEIKTINDSNFVIILFLKNSFGIGNDTIAVGSKQNKLIAKWQSRIAQQMVNLATQPTVKQPDNITEQIELLNGIAKEGEYGL